MDDKSKKANRYMISFSKYRSVIAVIACSITLLFSAFAICGSIVLFVRDGEEVSKLFRYFTTLSNSITALASGFILPYAINGIRKQRFIYPKWMCRFHCAGTICTTLTFIFALACILPVNRELAIGGYNTYLHIVCPLTVLISFFMMEISYDLTVKDMFLCLIPAFLYTLVYLIMVVLVGEDKGGWDDIYMVTKFIPPFFSLLAVWALALAIAFGIIKTENHINSKRRKRMLDAFDKNDFDPVELKIEVFGLGRFYGEQGEEDDLSVPYDILDALAKKYSLNIYELLSLYTKGLIDGVKEHSEKNNE